MWILLHLLSEVKSKILNLKINKMNNKQKQTNDDFDFSMDGFKTYYNNLKNNKENKSNNLLSTDKDNKNSQLFGNIDITNIF